jgi:hypothetical protein
MMMRRALLVPYIACFCSLAEQYNKKGAYMSKWSKTDFVCPTCGAEFEITIWDSLNTALNPKEKEMMLTGELFVVACEKCSAKHNVIYPMLYHDMENKVMIQLILKDEDIEKIRRVQDISNNLAIMKEIVGDMANNGYRYRFAKSHKELLEKAKIFGCGLDDRVVETIRIQQQASYYDSNDDNKNNKITDMVFHVYDSKPGFLLYTEKNQTYHVPIDMEVYSKFVEAKKDVLDAEEGNYLIVDDEWVYSFFENQW